MHFLQRLAKRWAPECVIVEGKARQKWYNVYCVYTPCHICHHIFQGYTLGAPERKWLKARQGVLLSKILDFSIPIHFWYLNNAGLCITGRYVSAKQIISCAARQALVVIS